MYMSHLHELFVNIRAYHISQADQALCWQRKDLSPSSSLSLPSNNVPEPILGRHKRQLPLMDYLAAHKNCKTQSRLLFALLLNQQYLFSIEAKNGCAFGGS